MTTAKNNLLQNLDALTIGSWNEGRTGTQNYGIPVTLTVQFLDPAALPSYMLGQSGKANYLVKYFGVDFPHR